MVLVSSCNVDTIFRKLGKPNDEEIIGKLFGRNITLKESKEHPEILQNPAFLSVHRMNTEDWKCNYCGYLRPKGEYKCGICGGPR